MGRYPIWLKAAFMPGQRFCKNIDIKWQISYVIFSGKQPFSIFPFLEIVNCFQKLSWQWDSSPGGSIWKVSWETGAKILNCFSKEDSLFSSFLVNKRVKTFYRGATKIYSKQFVILPLWWKYLSQKNKHDSGRDKNSLVRHTISVFVANFSGSTD